MQPNQIPLEDPLSCLKAHPDAYRGAVLLSDQIEYYIRNLTPPLLSNPDRSPLAHSDLHDPDEGCLDAASYKLRLGNEAHVNGRRTEISNDKPLILAPHQMAVVKTHECINIPGFLVARWNLRVQWVYEGILWVGGPQVDPGWQGQLYCPVYNLAEREVVIPYMERVFTMDFTRTTPVHQNLATYGFKTKPHKAARPKNLQGHDRNRLRSAPFELLEELKSLSEFRSLAFSMLAVGFAALGAITAALAIIAIRPVLPASEASELLAPWPLTAVSLSLFASVLSIFAISRRVFSQFERFIRRGESKTKRENK